MTALVNPEHHSRKANPAGERQIIFDHLQASLQAEPPARIVERYRKLFINGTAYPTPRVLTALERLAASIQTAPDREEFFAFIGRCWYLPINQWMETSQLQPFIPELTELFDEMPPPTKARGAGRLREAVRPFMETSQYLRLRRLGRLIERYQGQARGKDASGQLKRSNNAGTIGSSLVRYPFLYEYCYLREEDLKSYRKRILMSRDANQKRFEDRLARYAVVLIRERYGTGSFDDPSSARFERERTLKAVRNPTMLPQENLIEGIRMFIEKIDGKTSYQDLAKGFNLRAAQIRTYRKFKAELYDYTIAAAKPAYVEKRFKQSLHQFFEKLQSTRNDDRPDETLQHRSYCQLMNFLVVESSQSPSPLQYLDMVSQQGVLKSMDLLLRIVMLAPEKVGPYLEKRYAILFDHYDNTPREEVTWLTKSLEFWQLAHTIYFRNVDMSIWKQLY